MLVVPAVSSEMMSIARAVAYRPGRRDIINTMMQEHRDFDFDDVYAAAQRLYALSYILANTNTFDPWIAPPAPGEAYSEISPALWQVVATARLERDEEELFTQARFDSEDLRNSLKLGC